MPPTDAEEWIERIREIHTPIEEEVEFYCGIDEDYPTYRAEIVDGCKGGHDHCAGHTATIEVCSECGYTHDDGIPLYRQWPCPTIAAVAATEAVRPQPIGYVVVSEVRGPQMDDYPLWTDFGHAERVRDELDRDYWNDAPHRVCPILWPLVPVEGNPTTEKQPCHQCVGSGVVAGWEGEALDCARCDGTGLIPVEGNPT